MIATRVMPQPVLFIKLPLLVEDSHTHYVEIEGGGIYYKSNHSKTNLHTQPNDKMSSFVFISTTVLRKQLQC